MDTIHLDLVDLRVERAELVGRHLELLEENAICNPYWKASIFRDKSVLYAF